MTLEFGSLLKSDSKLYAKSEFGPANPGWPALSFSAMKIANNFQAKYRRDRDFVIYVGTSNPADTPEPTHRQNLISVVEVEPRGVVTTKDLVDSELWRRAQAKYPGRWDYSLVLSRAWEIVGFPGARDAMPATYRLFRNPSTRGHPVEVVESDFSLLSGLVLSPTPLQLSKRANAVISLNSDDLLLKRHLTRLASLIQSDVARSQQISVGINPVRYSPNLSDLFALLNIQWNKQRGICPLCGEPINLAATNKLLQISRDRIDSHNKGYVDGNLHLTHLGCNIAKSDASIEEWAEYREMLRGKGV